MISILDPFGGPELPRPIWFILDQDKKPVGTDVTTLAKFMDDPANVVVGETTLGNGLRVSTVFLGIDASIWREPLLFETMVFKGTEAIYELRYATWKEAEEGHKMFCAAFESHDRFAA